MERQLKAIGRKMFFTKKPNWLGGHDHLSSIPNTNSFVFYPYNDDEADEKFLNERYNKFGYKVIKRPKRESEYNSAEHQTYKVLILEPNYDERKIDEGLELIAQFYRSFALEQHLDVFEK
jgi:hypothetical protein